MSSQTKPAAGRTLIYVHSREFKPAREIHRSLCTEALHWGVQRDHPALAGTFDELRIETAYYGDVTGQWLTARGREFDEALDIADRHNVLGELKKLDKSKKFSLPRYDKLPGKSAFKEFLTSVGAPLARPLGLSGKLISAVAPEMTEYWRKGSDYAATLQARLTEPLCAAFDRGDEVALVAHGMGCVVAWDVLWELSRGKHAGRYAEHKVGLLLTLGAPLGDETVKSRLRGAKHPLAERYPGNVLLWQNVAAEDDYFCYDGKIADDFAPMLKQRLISRIDDYICYNLAVRYGRSNPHSSLGYLIHPRCARSIAHWLAPEAETPLTAGAKPAGDD